MRKKVLLMVVIIICIALFPINANADTGPKPSITIHCSNMPETTCYLDLLVKNRGENKYDNIRNINDYNQQLIKKLENYSTDGWYSAMIYGWLLFGELDCDVVDGECTQYFSYFGVPDRFKIIVVTDNKTVVSNEINRVAFQSTIHFNYEMAEAKEVYEKAEAKEVYILWSYILQFLMTCIATLVIEGLILLMFRFNIKTNLKPFLLINIATQIALNLIVAFQMIRGGTTLAIFSYVVFELFIIMIEPALFVIFLKQHSITRRALFAISANLISFIIGSAILNWTL